MPEAPFAKRLKELRGRAGLSQSQLAEAAGMSKTGVANLEQGIRGASWDTVLALAEALGVTPNDFRPVANKRAKAERRKRK